MLEPAVRPVATPPSGAAKPAATFESQSFERLLQAAQEGEAVSAESEAKPAAPDPLASLARIDAVNNASLRRLLQPTD